MNNVLPGLDFESFSECDIKKHGAWVYSEHPTTELLCFSYDMGNGVQRWRPGMPAPQDLIDYINRGGLIEASNDFFEYAMWENICHKRMGWPRVPYEQWRDLFARARAFGYKASLETLGDITDVPVKKDKVGKRVMMKLAKPRKPTKLNKDTRWTRESAPEDFVILEDYCDDDVITQRQISPLIPELNETEHRVMLLDKKINALGIYCDLETVNAAIDVFEQAVQKYTRILQETVGDTTITAGKVKQLTEWLSSRGVYVSDLSEETVSKYLKKDNLAPDIRTVFEIRDKLAGSAPKKLYAMRDRAGSDGRIRDFLSYCGASGTGRWAGAGIQPQNFPNSGPDVCECSQCGYIYWDGHPMCFNCFNPKTEKDEAEWSADAMRVCMQHIRTRNLELVEQMWGDAINAISGCLRGMLQAAPGKKLYCSDYSAIEARVIAHLAGEQWRLDVFKTHGKIYEMSASKISGIPFEEFERYKKETGSHHPMRKKIGKPAELGSGYAGWVNAWKNFGADKFLTDEEIKDGVLKWRAASPNIVKLWDGLEECATRAILAGMPESETNAIWIALEELSRDEDWKTRNTATEMITKYFPVNKGPAFVYQGIYYQSDGKCLYCRLPSGRFLHYHTPNVRLDFSAWGAPTLSLKYWGIDQTTKQWRQLDTYRGKLTNNVVQGYARDILAACLLRLDERGYNVVMHIHDEVVCENDPGFGTIEEFEEIMRELPDWAEGCPIDASGGYIDDMFQK